MVAIMSLGYIAFPLSPRNNPVVTAHLFEKMNPILVFTSEDSAMQGLAQDANKLLDAKIVQTWFKGEKVFDAGV